MEIYQNNWSFEEIYSFKTLIYYGKTMVLWKKLWYYLLFKRILNDGPLVTIKVFQMYFVEISFTVLIKSINESPTDNVLRLLRGYRLW